MKSLLIKIGEIQTRKAETSVLLRTLNNMLLHLSLHNMSFSADSVTRLLTDFIVSFEIVKNIIII